MGKIKKNLIFAVISPESSVVVVVVSATAASAVELASVELLESVVAVSFVETTSKCWNALLWYRLFLVICSLRVEI